MLLDIFQQIFQTLEALFINIPVNNELGLLYVIFNTIAVIFLGIGVGEIDLPF